MKRLERYRSFILGMAAGVGCIVWAAMWAWLALNLRTEASPIVGLVMFFIILAGVVGIGVYLIVGAVSEWPKDRG